MSDTSTEVLETRMKAQEIRDRLCEELAKARLEQESLRVPSYKQELIDKNRFPWERRRRYR